MHIKCILQIFKNSYSLCLHSYYITILQRNIVSIDTINIFQIYIAYRLIITNKILHNQNSKYYSISNIFPYKILYSFNYVNIREKKNRFISNSNVRKKLFRHKWYNIDQYICIKQYIAILIPERNRMNKHIILWFSLYLFQKVINFRFWL